MIIAADNLPLARHSRVKRGDPEKFSEFGSVLVRAGLFPVFEDRNSVDLFGLFQYSEGLVVGVSRDCKCPGILHHCLIKVGVLRAVQS